MLYAYIALNAENQKLKGVIAANTEQQAKKKLHQVGLSILSLRETSKNEESSVNTEFSAVKKKLPSFTFFVIDPQGKHLSGNIEAKDKKNALKRLSQEYGFEILSLSATTVPEQLRFEKGKQDLQELEEELEEEFGMTFKHSQTDNKEHKHNLYDEDFQEERKDILKEIELVAQKTQEILNKYHEKIPPEEQDETNSLLNQLNRLRFSNNFILIRKLIEDLFAKVDYIMKHYILIEDEEEKDYQILLEEEEKKDIIISKRTRNPHKDVIGKLKNFSQSLDLFLGERSKSRKKRNDEEFILAEAIEDASFYRRIIKNFFKAIFTQNKTLKTERIQEVKKRYNIWKKVKKKKEETRHQKDEKKKARRLAQKDFFSKKDIFFTFIVEEIYTFLGALLFSLFVMGYISFLFYENKIEYSSPFLEKLLHSSALPPLSIGVFFLFFTFSMQKKFFAYEMQNSLIFMLFSFLTWGLYFYNL